MDKKSPLTHTWLTKANVLVLVSEIRKHYPDYPNVTANQLDELPVQELHELFRTLESMIRSCGQLVEKR